MELFLQRIACYCLFSVFSFGDINTALTAFADIICAFLLAHVKMVLKKSCKYRFIIIIHDTTDCYLVSHLFSNYCVIFCVIHFESSKKCWKYKTFQGKGLSLQNRRLRVQVLVPLPRSPNSFCSVIFFFVLLLIAFSVPKVRFSPTRFFAVLCFPLFFPLLGRICFPYGFIESLHSCGTIPLHFFCYMTVNVQRKSCCGMA